MADGKVIISTALDNSNIEKDVREVSGEFGGLEKVLSRMSKTISGAMEKPVSEACSKIRKELSAVEKQIAQCQKQIQKSESAKMPMEEQANQLGAALDAAKAKLEELQAKKASAEGILSAAGSRELSGPEIDAYMDAFAQKPELDKAVIDQQAQVDALQKKWDDCNNKIDEYTYKINQANQEMSAQQIAAGELRNKLDAAEKETKEIRKNVSGSKKEMGAMGKAVTQFLSRLKSITMGALIFNVISAGLREVTDYLGKTLQVNKEFTVELANLKGALLTAFQPIYEAVVPAVIALMRILTAATVVVATFFASLSGKTLESSAEAAKGLYDQADALGKVEKSAKKAGKSLAGFDEINALQGNSGGTSSGSDIATPNFSVKEWLPNGMSAVFEKLKEKILDGDWFGVGKDLANTLIEGLEKFDWEAAGKKVGKLVGNLFMLVLGFLVELDPITVTKAVLEASAKFLGGLFTSLAEVIQKFDWVEIGKDIYDFLLSSILFVLITSDPLAVTAALLAFLFTPEGTALTAGASEFVGSALGALVSAFTGAVSRMRELSIEIWNAIIGWFDKHIDWGDTPGEIIAGLLEGIVAAFSGIREWIWTNLWEPFWEGFCEAAGIDGETSQEMKGIGTILVDGLVLGAVGNIENVKQACKEVWEAIQEPFTGVSDWFESTFSDAWDKIVSVWDGAASWFNENVIVPLQEFWAPISEWFSELFGSIEQTLSDVFYNIGVIASGCWEIIKEVWSMVSEWFDTTIIQPVAGFFSDLWTGISSWATEAWENIKSAFAPIGEWIDTTIIQPVSEFFSDLWEGFEEKATEAWENVKGVFSGIAQWAKDILNEFIRSLNSGLSKIFSGINSGLGKLRDLRIGELQPFANISRISTPQIPYLAQGAVLPANKPFLAMVGDQKHGTNIEAPLSTIQEAVAMVMQDQTQAILAGFEASVGVQREILEAVLGIQIGDDVIGSAVARYSRKQAVMRGGAL